MSIEEKVEALRSEFDKKLNDILAEGKAGTPTEHGWYSSVESESSVGNNRYHYPEGFWLTYEDSWLFNGARTWYKPVWRKMTKDEVEEMLVAEAKRRGFKEGVIVSNKNIGFSWKQPLNNTEPDKTYYTEYDDKLAFMACYVYQKGQWAVIIKDEIKVGSHIVEFLEGKIKVGCTEVSDELLRKIYEKQFGIKNVRESA